MTSVLRESAVDSKISEDQSEAVEAIAAEDVDEDDEGIVSDESPSSTTSRSGK